MNKYLRSASPRLRRIVFLLVAAIAALMAMSVYAKLRTRNSLSQIGSPLPAFAFVGTDSRPFSNESLPDRNAKLLVNYFDPECEHCQYMAHQLVSSASMLTDVQIIMVTEADSIAIRMFYRDYHLDSVPRLVMLRDPNFQFNRIFGAAITPSFYLYQHGTLIGKVTGETKFKNLLLFGAR